jgi:N-acetylglucosamine-6-phosphate deacetylase
MNLPGFIDLQVNGHRGVDFSDPNLTEEAFVRSSRELLAEGTAAFLPTIYTAPVDIYRRNLPLIASVMARPEFEGRLLGFHIEGPFISREPGAVGAHRPECVQAPSLPLLEDMHRWSGGRIKIMTIAAEAPGAEEFTRRAAALGMIVSLGHHLATEADLARVASAGATALTHLGNGVPNMLPRHPNPIWAGLAEDRLWAMLITDGHHIPGSTVKAMIRSKGVARTAVVSDQSHLAGMPPGRYGDAVLEPNGRLHLPAKGCLAGSASTMLRCMNFLASLGFLSLDEMLELGYYNPLKIIGVKPEAVRGKGRLEHDATRRVFSAK